MGVVGEREGEGESERRVCGRCGSHWRKKTTIAERRDRGGGKERQNEGLRRPAVG